VDLTGENPLDLRKIYIKRPASIWTPTTDYLPHTYNWEPEIIEEVNKVLEDKINTVIDLEYIPVNMINTGEILTKLYSNDNVDVIDYLPQDIGNYELYRRFKYCGLNGCLADILSGTVCAGHRYR
jgi:predicted nucleic-acid-binding protein